MRWHIYLIGFIACLLAASLSPAHAQSLQERYLKIYLKINDAENLEKQGDFAGALADFKDCYAGLEKIHNENPDWEKALVLHRMDDCKAKIIDLQNKVDSMPPPSPAAANPPPPENGGTPTNAPPATAEDVPNDVEGLKKRLMEVEQELQVTKANLADSQGMVETYRAQLETVNQQLVALKSQQSVDDRVGKLLNENKALSDKLAAAQKELDDYKANPKSKLAQADAQMKNLQDELEESQMANKSLQSTITNLQQHLDQAQADLVVANQKLAAAGPSSAEYTTIKRENEVMRDILTREIQEQARRDEAKRLAQEEYDNLKLKSKVLQEQLDILGSPMTPPSTDEERTLLASMKVSGSDVEPPPSAGNILSVPASGSTPDTSTNMASSTPPPPTTPDATTTPAPAPDATASTNSAPMADTNSTTPTPTPDNSTNQAPVTVAANNAATPPATTDSSASTTNNAPAATDPSSNTTPPAPPAPTPDNTMGNNTTTPAVTPPTTTTTTPDASTPPVTPPTTDSTTPAPSSPAPTDTTPTVSHVPGPETTVTDTTIAKDTTPQSGDPTQYSTKARLPDDMRDTAQQAADLFKNQRYDEAAAKYQSIIDKYPESLYAWSNLGVVRFQQGDLNDALKALQQAVKLSPTDAFSYSNLGIVYYQLNQYENAIDALNSAKALDPNDAKTHNYLGCACSQKGWQEVAEKEFRKAIALDPSFGDAHFNLALVYATEKPPLLELARQEYKKALDLGIAKDDRLEKLLKPAQ